ncbi:MAG: hypothetical protein NVSMB24_02730 [Mucilaginibacter sp.]
MQIVQMLNTFFLNFLKIPALKSSRQPLLTNGINCWPISLIDFNNFFLRKKRFGRDNPEKVTAQKLSPLDFKVL